MLGGLLFLGLVAPSLIVLHLFQAQLLVYFTLLEAIGLTFALTFIFFSSTLFYIVILANDSIRTDQQRLYATLLVTSISFGIDLGYCYVLKLSFSFFATTIVSLYVFFLVCFLIAKVRELRS